MAQLRWLH
uniref:Uncharacterized protein n=1 Tax=Rhizophora mucronata TaxID=61149 RepID=A0A2P2PHK4_RHIMU